MGRDFFCNVTKYYDRIKISKSYSISQKAQRMQEGITDDHRMIWQINMLFCFEFRDSLIPGTAGLAPL